MILDGKVCAQYLKQKLHNEIQQLEGRKPHCSVILIGNDPASQTYVKNKENAFVNAGMNTTTYHLDETVSQQKVMELIQRLNTSSETDGILLQLPIPKHLDKETIIETIDPHKDVDGLTKYNQARWYSQEGILPCTPYGIMKLLEYYDLSVEKKHVVIVGRSDLVGRPLAQLMLSNNATVTVCHSKTQNLKQYTQMADILVVAAGQPEMIDRSYVSPACIVIDVGIHRKDHKLVGDVCRDVQDYVCAMTPVPGGVGVMTVTMLLYNTYQAYRRHYAQL